MDDVVRESDGPFGTVDPKLTVFALANGVDLSKSDDHRRLEWFSEGYERGIWIGAAGDGRFDVGVLKWSSGSVVPSEPTPFRAGVSGDELIGLLDDVVGAANGL